LAGERENNVGTAVPQDPVALTRGVAPLKAKLGTLGMQIARTIATLPRHNE